MHTESIKQKFGDAARTVNTLDVAQLQMSSVELDLAKSFGRRAGGELTA